MYNVKRIGIKVDDREQTSGIPQLLKSNPEFECSIERLVLGDYLIDGWLLVERKQLKDLVGSLISGRLFEQVSRLADSEFKTALLIEGNAQEIKDYKMHRHALLGALTTVSLIYGISVLRSFNQDESIRLMYFAATQRAKRNKNLLPRCGRRPKTPTKRQLFFLQGLPGVGPALAARLLNSFGSPKAVFEADISELCRVEGIGQVKAEAIYNMLSNDCRSVGDNHDPTIISSKVPNTIKSATLNR